MQRISLNGQWELTYGPQREGEPASPRPPRGDGWTTIPAMVPGNVELDMLAAGRIEEPSVGNRIYACMAHETYEWWYSRTFSSPALRPGQRAELVFEGVDCLGTVWLNGALVGSTDNMLIAHRFDVTDVLSAKGDNKLVVRLRSAMLEGRRRVCAPGEFASPMLWESLSVRKAAHMYGWDILPRLVSAGLWRDVELHVLEPTRLRSVYWATLGVDPVARKARVLVDWDFTTEHADLDGLRVEISLTRDGRTVHRSEGPAVGTHGRATLSLRDVELWWPRGYGEPALYDARLALQDESGRELDAWSGHIGLRTVELRRTEVTTPDKPGEFVFVVNGRKAFARGTNWVALDALHSRDAGHLPAACAMLADLNCNMVRCWGGNVYESHAFFDFCDAHGIMVWQDFALACAVHPQTDEFACAMRREAEAVITKLRNHPSLVLWAGNNEVDEAFGWAGTGLDPNDDRLSRRVLPEVVRRLDPLRPYLPSSPYRSPKLVRRGNDPALQPEAHLWGPRGYFKGAFYTESPAHFVSEIGYHGCPSRRSLEQMMDPGHVWPWQGNDQWLTHAVRSTPDAHNCDYRIPLMAGQIEHLLGDQPTDLDDFVLASQITQAEALKFFVELWRSRKWRRTGMLWWNLRDGWPVISDAVVDYYGRRKLAYAYLKRVQADVCVICAEPNGGRHPLVVVNDTLSGVSGSLRVRDADGGRVLLENRFRVEPNGSTEAGALQPPARRAMWLIEWATDDGAGGRNHYLAGERPFRLDEYKAWLQRLDIPAEEWDL